MLKGNLNQNVLLILKLKTKKQTIMKKVMLSFAVMLFMAVVTSVNAQAKIEFEKMVHDYGTINQGADGASTFSFTNTGTEPLIISNARGSCGCTVPEWPKDPIAPGKTAVITVKYDTKRVGPINKQVTIESNGSTEPVILRIKGTVNQESTAPVKSDGGAPKAQ
jgi:hypothetical protein